MLHTCRVLGKMPQMAVVACGNDRRMLSKTGTSMILPDIDTVLKDKENPLEQVICFSISIRRKHLEVINGNRASQTDEYKLVVIYPLYKHHVHS
jgi:hypothetical protein